MNWNRLPDGRTYLPEGSIIRFTETGSCYEITGPPVGYGGSGILYPAVRVRRREGTWEKEEMRIALKECYPIVPGTVLERDGDTVKLLVDEATGTAATFVIYAIQQIIKPAGETKE